MRKVVGFLGKALVALALIASVGIAIRQAHFAFERGAAMEPSLRGERWHREALTSFSELFPTRTIARGGAVSALPRAQIDLAALPVRGMSGTLALEEALAANRTRGLVVLHAGNLVYERYYDGADSGTRFTSFSVAKSVVATLVGLALGEGRIPDLDQTLGALVPGLSDSAYRDVPVRDALRMSSGIDFDESYGGLGGSDVDRYFILSVIGQLLPSDFLARRYPRSHPTGTRFNYNTAETQVLAHLVRERTGRTLSAYLEAKLWKPLGMEHDASWVLDRPGPEGVEMAGCCLNAALRDWARIGRLHALDGVWQGRRILPEGWVAEATRAQPGSAAAQAGYGYQWWLRPQGAFAAEGVFGQFIFVDPARDLVIAKASAWPLAWSQEYEEQAFSIFDAIAARFTKDRS